MTFDAYHDAREAAVTAMQTVFPAKLAEVGAERGITAKALRAVYRHSRGQPNDAPFAIVGQARGDINDDGAIATDCSMVIICVEAGSHPDEMDAITDAYLTAVVRTFAHSEHSGIYFEATAFDADQPAPTGVNAQLVQTCGVNVTAHIVESP